MNRNLLRGGIAALSMVAFAACSDSTEPSLGADEYLAADLAVAAGDAIVDDVGELIANETFAGLPVATPSFSLLGMPPGVTVNRTRTCYDAGVAQVTCDPLTTDSIVITLTMNGSFSRSVDGPRGATTLDRAIHRARLLTISGLDGTETSRTHNGTGISADTTVFTATGNQGGSISRTMTELSLDSIQAVVFNLPRVSNPWPVSGSIVRNVTGSFELVIGDRSESRTFTRRVAVTFPADAQGNVTIQINDRTCTLNLVTRVITNCS